MLRTGARQGDIVAVSRTSIPLFLRRVRALVYRHEARRTTFHAFAAVAAVALVLPLLGIALIGSRATALALLGAAGLVVVLLLASAVVLGFVAPRRRWGSDPELARWVGGRRREVASDLLSSVELANAPARPGAPSPALVAALIEATSVALGRVEPSSLVQPAELRRARRWAIAAVAAHVAVLAVVPRVVADGWHALLSAGSAPFD